MTKKLYAQKVKLDKKKSGMGITSMYNSWAGGIEVSHHPANITSYNVNGISDAEFRHVFRNESMLDDS